MHKNQLAAVRNRPTHENTVTIKKKKKIKKMVKFYLFKLLNILKSHIKNPVRLYFIAILRDLYWDCLF